MKLSIITSIFTIFFTFSNAFALLPGDRVLFFTDSRGLTGWNEPGGTIASKLRGMLDDVYYPGAIEVLNHPVPGETTWEAQVRMHDLLTVTVPPQEGVTNWLVLWHGTNDLLRDCSISANESAKNSFEIARWAHKKRVNNARWEPIVLDEFPNPTRGTACNGLQDWFLWTTERNQELANRCGSTAWRNVHCIDAGFGSNHSVSHWWDIWPDVHPNDELREILALILLDKLLIAEP